MKNRSLMAYVEEMKVYGSVMGLSSIVALCKELGNPQDSLRIIHIAGTNGKGSTSCFIRGGLMANNYKVGGFNSPMVFEYEEIIHVNNKSISEDKMWELYQIVEEACKKIVDKGGPHPTLFEIETAASFLYFQEEQCDFVVLEVGLGGIMDATNVIKNPLVTVLTSISRDHWEVLGDSLTQIGQAKAGIMKKGCSCVSLTQSLQVTNVIREIAKEKHVPLTFVEPMNWDKTQQMQLKMLGYYQRENVVLAMTVCEILNRKSVKINTSKYKEGVQKAQLPGRFEVIQNNPTIVLDGAHNEDAAKKLRHTIELIYPNRKIFFVLGIFKDKDYGAIVRELVPLAKLTITVKPPTDRGLDSGILGEEVAKYGGAVKVGENLSKAMSLAKKQAENEGIIVVCGSLSFLREAKKWSM